MEIGERREPLEILPENIGTLPSIEAAPLLTRAASRIEITRPRSDFREGLNENLRGLAGWIEAQKGKFKGKTLNVIATATLVTTLISACSKPPDVAPYIPTEEPRITEVIPTETPFPTETSTPLPTPTVEPSPTPTEVPMYSGPLVDASEYRGLNVPEIQDWDRDILKWDVFVMNFFKRDLTLISDYQEDGVTIHIWGFTLGDQNYRFKTRTAVCWTPEATGGAAPMGIEFNTFGDDSRGLGGLETGKDYTVGFAGLNAPLTQEELNFKIEGLGGRDLNVESCQRIWGGLRGDPQDVTRLERFFWEGDITGLAVNEDGIVDLTSVITDYVGSREPIRK